MRIIFILFFISNICFAQQSVVEKSCKICELEYSLDLVKKQYVKSIVNNNSKTVKDSIKALIEKKENLLDSLLLNNFQLSNNESKGIDSIKGICFDHFASHFEKLGSNRDSVMTFLYEELYSMSSGYHISYNDLIKSITSELDSNEREFVIYRGDKIFIEDLSIWKENELNNWSLWMNKIDSSLVQIFGETYFNLSLRELSVLDHYLRDYGHRLIRHSQNSTDE